MRTLFGLMVSHKTWNLLKEQWSRGASMSTFCITSCIQNLQKEIRTSITEDVARPFAWYIIVSLWRKINHMEFPMGHYQLK
jgi:hypothetical protein